MSRQLVSLDPNHAVWRRDLCVSLKSIGDLETRLSRLQAARDAYEEALAAARHLADLDPAIPDSQHLLAAALGGLALAWETDGRREKAQSLWREASETLERLRLRGQLAPLWAEDFAAAEAGLVRTTPVRPAADIPSPRLGTDPQRASRLNIEYQQALGDWKKLPLLTRLVTKKPEPVLEDGRLSQQLGRFRDSRSGKRGDGMMGFDEVQA